MSLSLLSSSLSLPLLSPTLFLLFKSSIFHFLSFSSCCHSFARTLSPLVLHRSSSPKTLNGNETKLFLSACQQYYFCRNLIGLVSDAQCMSRNRKYVCVCVCVWVRVCAGVAV